MVNNTSTIEILNRRYACTPLLGAPKAFLYLQNVILYNPKIFIMGIATHHIRFTIKIEITLCIIFINYLS